MFGPEYSVQGWSAPRSVKRQSMNMRKGHGEARPKRRGMLAGLHTCEEISDRFAPLLYSERAHALPCLCPMGERY